MSRCQTCKHWSSTLRVNENTNDTPEGYNACALTFNYGNQPDRAYAQDREDYMAVLMTAYDFGCVQWEQKTTEH